LALLLSNVGKPRLRLLQGCEKRVFRPSDLGGEDERHALDALKNPASSHVPGEVEAYVNLKHSLIRLIAEIEPTESHLEHLLKILQAHPGGVN